MQHLSRIEGQEVNEVQIKRALLSVYDKTDIVELARALEVGGTELLSTGGTAKLLKEAGIRVKDVSDCTEFPEILDGRVKTLHPSVHGGLLAVRGNQKHEEECHEHHIEYIDLVVMNLYPFEETVRSGADFPTCVENIDIGGPSMLRSGAKNHAFVTVLTSPAQYDAFLAKWQTYSSTGRVMRQQRPPFTTLQDRQQYAAAAFQLSAHYDAQIAAYFAAQVGERAGLRPSTAVIAVTKETTVVSATTQVSSQEFVLIPPLPPDTDIGSAPEAKSTIKQEPGVPSTETAASMESPVVEPEEEDEPVPGMLTRSYRPERTLKYGTNPHQIPAAIYSIAEPDVAPAQRKSAQEGQDLPRLPFTVLSGTPGYINLLDALYGWQLVKEAQQVLDVPVAASYKHCSPAGAALGSVPLSAAEAQAYEVTDPGELTATALAYLRARNADPLCSFGDFAALSHTVDICTARLIKPLVCDGIIAPGYEPEALALLQAKKKGAFIVLQAEEAFKPPDVEYREVHGVVFAQRRNDAVFSQERLNDVVVVGTGLQEGTTATGTIAADILPESARHDLILASIAVKYTQSNSVAYAMHGQLVGVGAGQQSRVDCVKLAGRKVATWFLRQHPKVQALPFKSSVRKQDRINARVRYIEGDITSAEMPFWLECFDSAPQPLSEAEKTAFLGTLNGVSISSDAFFPFRDSIDHASKYGVSYIAQPGGSIADQEVKDACAEYGMTMVFTNLRLFLH